MICFTFIEVVRLEEIKVNLQHCTSNIESKPIDMENFCSRKKTENQMAPDLIKLAKHLADGKKHGSNDWLYEQSDIKLDILSKKQHQVQ